VNHGAHCMNHYTNLKVQIVSKMSPQIFSVCFNVCMHTTTITLDQVSKISSYIYIYNLISEAF
jgi:hypothetical protein